MTNDAIAVVRDYLTLTGRRRDDMVGAKWPRGAPVAAVPVLPVAASPRPPMVPGLMLRRDPLPGNLPSNEARAVFASLLPAARLSLALRYAVMPLRRSSDRPEVGHRAVPSAAALFPVDTFVIAPSGDAVATYRCLPDAMALVRDDRVRLRSAIADPDTLTIVLLARLARCIDPYGELSPCLALIEAGMVEAQLSLMLGLAGWTVAVRSGAESRAALDCDLHWSDVPAILITVRGAGAGQALATLDPGLATDCRLDYAPLEAFGRVRGLLDAITTPVTQAGSPADCTSINRPATWRADLCLLRAAERRSSGGSSGYAWRRVIDEAAVFAMLWDVVTLESLLPSLATAWPTITVATCDVGDNSVRLLTLDRACGPTALHWTDREPGDAELPPGVSMLVTLGYDHAAEIAVRGAAAYATTHLSIGRLAQCFCLAAAAHGLAARPLRSFVQDAADAMLPLAVDAMLQIAIGPDVASPPSVSAEPAR